MSRPWVASNVQEVKYKQTWIEFVIRPGPIVIYTGCVHRPLNKKTQDPRMNVKISAVFFKSQ